MRIEGWEGRMMDYLDACARKNFDYGSGPDAVNCVMMASNHIDMMTGIDPLDGGRGSWTDLRSGVKKIAETRGSIAGIIDFYFPRHARVSDARRGDVVLLMVDGLKALGIVTTGGRAVFKAQGLGLIHRFVSECDIAWRID